MLDANITVRVKSDGTGVDLANQKMSMNPFDEIAVEEAVKLREAGIATEIVAVSIGPAQAQDTLRTALAMGADSAILVKTDETIEPLAVAKILKVIAEQQGPDLVIMGKQAIDDDSNQTAQMLSALLGWPQATFASKVEIADGKATVTREVDGGLENARDEPAGGCFDRSAAQHAPLCLAAQCDEGQEKAARGNRCRQPWRGACADAERGIDRQAGRAQARFYGEFGGRTR